MRNEISTYTMIDHNIAIALQALLDAGWKEIEVMCEGHGSELFTWSEEQLRDLKSKLESHGAALNFHAQISSFNPAGETDETLETWRNCLRLVEMFDSSYILFHPGRSKDTERGIERIGSFFAERIGELPEGTMLILENVPPYENEIGVNAEQLLEIGERLPDGRWGICFDTGHSYLYSRDEILNQLEKMMPKIRGFHFNDNHGKKDEHLAIGEGDIPFRDIAALIKKQGKEYFLNFEMNTIEDANVSKKTFHDWFSLENILEE